MSVNAAHDGVPQRYANADAAVSLLLVLLLHTAMCVAVSAHRAAPREGGAVSLLQANLIIEALSTPEIPSPEPIEVPPEMPRPKPPKVLDLPKHKRVVVKTPVPAILAEASAPAEPRAVSAPPVQTAAKAATSPAISQPVSPRFDAAYLNNPAPHYPSISRRLGEEGRVMLRVFVEPDGLPSQVKIHRPSGFPRLDAAAVEAVHQWRFVPARQGAAQIGAWVLVPIAFSLRS